MFRRLIACFAFVTILAAPAAAQDAADAIVRINRLESQFRQMSGQIEELQFENRQLKEQLRKFQEDVEFRFQEGRGGSKAAPPAAAPARPAQPQAQPQRRSDVFDPSEAPGAPGAPLPLGSTPPSAPLASADAVSPMPIPSGAVSGIEELIESDEMAAGGGPLDLSPASRTSTIPQGAGGAILRANPDQSVAAASVSDPRSDYATAYAYLTRQQFDQAEMGFRRFLQSNPRDKLVPDASYWLGETYLQRGRYREAAEQFLNVSTDHPDAARAPEALLKLGVALSGLGAHDRACAVYAEIERKYPQAPATVRQGAEREQKRAKCS
ncbi:tol-pal system protein YbgF [Microvirga lenta]|uniref:tol-pal system protein YbgF n=1 Tax=Microvirga lenta TaxID=2881337 RepID=UPI00384E5527